MSSNPLRVGFLGTGWIASVYADGLAGIPGVKITALCNRHLDKAQKFNADHCGAAATCYDDFDRMLASEKLDVLWICLPPGAHGGEAEKAASHGIHLMLEKPIALSLERAESIQRAVRAAGVQCQIGHHFRHTLPVLKLKQMLTDGSAGRPVFMQGRFFTNAAFPTWWRDPKLGGGQLVEQSIHLYDLARHLFGEPAVAFGFRDNLAHRRFPDYQVDDVSAATIRFRNGALANLCAANVWEPNTQSVEMSVLCERVLVKFGKLNEAEFIYHDGLKPEEIKQKQLTIKREVVGGTGYYAELARNLIAAIRGEEATRSSIDDGVESLRLVLAIAKSSAQGGEAQRF